MLVAEKDLLHALQKKPTTRKERSPRGTCPPTNQTEPEAFVKTDWYCCIEVSLCPKLLLRLRQSS
jgi:hypothetical protein